MRCLAALLAVVFMTMTGSAQSVAPALTGTVRVDGKPQKDVVIWLEGVSPAAPATPPAVLMDQRNLEFIPRVLAVQVGTRVKMPNSDRVFHNVFSFHDGKKFDLGLYPVGTTRLVTFDAAGVSRIFCNIHPNMAAYVVAVDSAYFAVTDARGRFSIDGVGPGSYAYRVWRSGRETSAGTVEVAAGRPVEIAWP